MRSEFARTWFFATNVKPTKMDWEGTLPEIVAKLHLLQHEARLHEFQWAEISPGGPIDGWFQPTEIGLYDVIAAIPGVTLLPHLSDADAVGLDLAKMLKHAGVLPTDTAYQAVKKMSDHHYKSPEGFKHPGLRPQLY